MTSPDPYLDARRLYFLSNAIPAIAAHLGIALDGEGTPITPPDDAPLVETVAAHIYARHTENRHTDWDDLSPAGRAPWITTAQAVIQLVSDDAATGGGRDVPSTARA